MTVTYYEIIPPYTIEDVRQMTAAAHGEAPAVTIQYQRADEKLIREAVADLKSMPRVLPEQIR